MQKTQRYFMASAAQRQSQSFKIRVSEIRGEVLAQHHADRLLLHTCFVNGKPSVIYPRKLPHTAPKSFAQLTQFGIRHGLQLIAERRSHNRQVAHNQRRPWLPILLFSISAAASLAETPTETQWKKTLNLTGDTRQTVLTLPSVVQEDARASKKFSLKNDSAQLHRILRNHFQAQVKDPHNIYDEIERLSEYYARFPDVVQLFEEIEHLEWDLKFKKRTFRTDVTGNSIAIEETTVYFDPHVGARLKFQSSCKEKVPYCVASPADALLHELLHVKSILRNTREYLANGGMGGLLYPFKHEHETIAQENDLYRAMTAIDGQPRPIRNEHTGRYVLVACSTCIE